MEHEQYRGENKREFYRVRYPINDRPILKLLGNEFEVIDISEQGLRFLCKQCFEFKPNLKVQFKVTFHDDESLALEGKILRIHENAVIIYLTQGIPLGRIIQEQKYIIAKHSDKFQI